MRFEHPHFLWSLLLALPLLAAFFVWAWRARRRAWTAFVSARLLPGLTESVSAPRQKARMVLLLAAVTLLIVVLARPQLGFSWDEAKSRGLDVVVAIDTSRSMLATDVAPNRLKRAQLAALDLKRLARGDRLGLVAFAGSAFLQCPLTVDNEVYRQSVESLDVNIIPQGGTALAEAIQAARGAFKEGNDNHKVMVIFTDGEDHDGHALEAAKAEGQDGMRIFTVGVGTPDGELLRLTDTQGRTEFLKDAEGNAVKSRLNEDLLKQLAQATGGFYLRMSGANTMNLLYERGLAPLPRGEIAAERIKRHHERFQWVLGLVLVLLLAEMFLPERKKAAGSAGRASAAAVADATRTAVVAALLMIPMGVSAAVDGALKEYRAGNYLGAQAAYEVLLTKKPGDPRLHFNAGTAAFQAGDFGAASNYFSAALTNAALLLQQRSYYNLGSAQYRIGEAKDDWETRLRIWEEAGKSYRNALALGTNDVDARFNLHFVQQQIAQLKERIRLREEDRLAKRRADEQAKLNRYGVALQIMQDRKSKNPENKEFDDYIQRLREINEIANPQKP